jgi:hypothetical protein
MLRFLPPSKVRKHLRIVHLAGSAWLVICLRPDLSWRPSVFLY